MRDTGMPCNAAASRLMAQRMALPTAWRRRGRAADQDSDSATSRGTEIDRDRTEHEGGRPVSGGTVFGWPRR
jgi:hypothetical protein